MCARMVTRGFPAAADADRSCGSCDRRGGAKRRITSPLLAFLILLLAGCASGPPTLRFETEGFLVQYVGQRDDFRDATYPARVKCKRIESIASEAAKARCAELVTRMTVWQSMDRAVLQAILTQSTITTEQIQAAMAAGKELLGLALTIAPMLAL